ncbi:MAG: hypothetical protein HOA02_11035, partial [Planctomycetes bacterium]|nr:hypothetical protein [Planctomycetota bacterium]
MITLLLMTHMMTLSEPLATTDGAVDPATPRAAREADYYQAVNIPVPSGIVLEVGGLAVGPGPGEVYASTRR